MENFTAEPIEPLEVTERVEDRGVEATPVEEADLVVGATRIKAVTFPVDLIDQIDAKRGEVPFSEFVADAIKAYLRN